MIIRQVIQFILKSQDFEIETARDLTKATLVVYGLQTLLEVSANLGRPQGKKNLEYEHVVDCDNPEYLARLSMP